MPTKHPRLNVVLEKPVMQSVRQLAKRDGVSVSLKARDLIRDALELYEDVYLGEIARKRMATFDRKTALTHEQVWGHVKRSRR